MKIIFRGIILTVILAFGFFLTTQVKIIPITGGQEEIISHLTNTDISKLSDLNNAKVQEDRELGKLKMQYQQSPSSVLKQQIVSQEQKLAKAEQNLQTALKTYEISPQAQVQLDEINKKQKSWIADYNNVFIKTNSEKKKLASGIIDFPVKPSATSYAQKASADSDSSLPDFFDWRNYNGQDYVTPVKDQDGCGSCWAFGAIGALEGSINAYFNNPNLDIDLSEQDLISCFATNGCSGVSTYGIVDIFSSYYKNTGISEESCFPYTATNNSCANKCSDWQNKVWKTVSYEKPNLTADEIKKTLMKNGPAEAVMIAYGDLFAYTSGIYYHTTDAIVGGHAVTIVGFGKDENGINYWIVKNSWGTGWGENGYFKIYAGDSEIDSGLIIAVDMPVSPYAVEKKCNDNDQDGYCNWGLGQKPANGCPACSATIEDCDDSNTSIYQGCGASAEASGGINVSSNPSGADVYILNSAGGWVILGQTPLQAQLTVGNKKIKITKTDYRDTIKEVTIKEGEAITLEATLELSSKITFPLNNDIFRAGDTIEIKGRTSSGDFKNYVIEWGSGKNPTIWSAEDIILNDGNHPVADGVLGIWKIKNLTSFYTLRLTVNYTTGEPESLIKIIYADSSLKEGWPQRISWQETSCDWSQSQEAAAKWYTLIPKSQEEVKSSSAKTVSKEEFLKAENNYVKSSIADKCYFWAGYLEPVVVDLDNDNNKEIIVFRGGNLPRIMVYRQDGSLFWSKDFGSGGALGANSRIPLVGDINNDGFNEIFAYSPEIDLSDPYGPGKLYGFDRFGNLLPGWPVLITPRELKPTMLMADLDFDGKKEIVFKGNDSIQEQIFIIDYTGKIKVQWDEENDLFGAGLEGSPAVGNFDNDSALEIVSAAPSKNARYDDDSGNWISQGVIYVYNMDGSVVSGWPVYTDGVIFSSPIVGDINNDGENEIVVGVMAGANEDVPNLPNGGVYAFDKNGEILPGWPVEKGWSFWSSPSLADFDRDGYLEVAISRMGGVTYLIRYDGTIASGWPQSTGSNDYYSTIVGDVNNDNVPDVLTTAGSMLTGGGVYAWDFGGNPIERFPKLTEIDAQAPATVTDIDNDGKLELIASSDWDDEGDLYKLRSSIYVWEIDSQYKEENMPWLTFMHDNQRTGRYDTPSPACQYLYEGIFSTYLKKCGDASYNPVFDFNKDRIINALDFSLIAANINNKTWCAAKKASTENPCVISVSSCSYLQQGIVSHYLGSCGSAKYDPVFDLNKDKIINILDYSAVAANMNDEIWCSTKKAAITSPCTAVTIP